MIPAVKKHFRTLTTLWLLLFFLQATLCCATASEKLFKPAFEQGKQLAKVDNFIDAEKQLEYALANSEHLKPDAPELLDLYDELGLTYLVRGKLKKAEAVLTKCLELRQKTEKPSEFKTFVTMSQLANVYTRQDRVNEAEAIYKKGLDMFKGSGPIKSLIQATVHTALGGIYLQQGRNQEAIDSLKAALATRKKSMLKFAVPEDQILEFLGMAYLEQNQIDDAITALEQAHALAQKKAQKSPRDLATIKGNLASAYIEKNRRAEAKKLLEESLASLEKLEGKESANIATLYNKLAGIALDENNYSEAETLANRSLLLNEKLLGENNTAVAKSLFLLIRVARNRGKYQEAEQLSTRAMQIYKRALGQNKTETAYAMIPLCWVYLDRHKFQEAEALCREAIRIVNSTEGPNAHSLPLLLEILSQAELGLHKSKEAAETLQEALAILESDKYASLSTLSDVYSDLANQCRSNLDYEQSAGYFLKAIDALEKRYGPSDARLLGDLETLALVYEKQGKADESASIKTRIADIKSKNPELKDTSSRIKYEPLKSNAESSSDTPYSNKIALVIGISEFKDPSINDLRFAAKDAVDFSEFLAKEANFKTQNIKLLTDANASREMIIKNIGDDWLGTSAKKDDLVVLYISSHGSAAKGEAGGVNFLVAHDTKANALLSTGIPLQWLSEMIKEQVNSNRVVIILDVCHSGAAGESDRTQISFLDEANGHGQGGSKSLEKAAIAGKAGKKGIDRSENTKYNRGLERDDKFDVERVAAGEGQAIICSSAPEQISWESKKYPNSVFTRKLIEGLRQNSGTSDLNQAFNYLKQEVGIEVLKDRGVIQTPVFFSKNWRGTAPVLSAPSN